MDRISPLPDSILLKILSFLCTEEVVSTMVLSKRWQPLWMMVPELYFDDEYYDDSDYVLFSRFVDRSLLLHKAPILEKLHFVVSQASGVGDIPLWTRAADKLSVRELIIEIDSSSSASPAILPRSLYTGIRMLVTLKLNNVILVDVSSSVSFPFLKTLSLVFVRYSGGDEFVKRFLSNCPVLEKLDVEQGPDDNVTVFTVRVPSLKILYLHRSSYRGVNDADGFVIDAPSLKLFGIDDYVGGFCVIEHEMPNIVKAVVDADYESLSKFLGSITSVNRLHLCVLYSKDAYPVGSVFHRLIHLKMCTCEPDWLNLFMRLLRDSPKLKYLELKQSHAVPNRPRPCWNEPSSIPECLLSSLETLEWVNYVGTEEEIQVAAYILRNGSCLKKVTISSKPLDRATRRNILRSKSFNFGQGVHLPVIFHSTEVAVE